MEGYKFKGIASTPKKDDEGDFIDPFGMDLSKFKWVNWNHVMADNPNNPKRIIGEITNAWINKEGELEVEGELFAENETAKVVVALADSLVKAGNGGYLQLSIEGNSKANNKKTGVIAESELYSVAIAPSAINSGTSFELVKSKDYAILELDTKKNSAKKQEINCIFSIFNIEKSKGKFINLVNDKKMNAEEKLKAAEARLGIVKGAKTDFEKGCDMVKKAIEEEKTSKDITDMLTEKGYDAEGISEILEAMGIGVVKMKKGNEIELLKAAMSEALAPFKDEMEANMRALVGKIAELEDQLGTQSRVQKSILSKGYVPFGSEAQKSSEAGETFSLSNPTSVEVGIMKAKSLLGDALTMVDTANLRHNGGISVDQLIAAEKIDFLKSKGITFIK